MGGGGAGGQRGMHVPFAPPVAGGIAALGEGQRVRGAWRRDGGGKGVGWGGQEEVRGGVVSRSGGGRGRQVRIAGGDVRT